MSLEVDLRLRLPELDLSLEAELRGLESIAQIKSENFAVGVDSKALPKIRKDYIWKIRKFRR